ncbi:DUF3119 family protein [Chamaesiphon polymorphus]|uniref:DUF3119 domain-containing protein n=1 Tax=Chamaesiphon polymorphus CCALA 037 TaxID=2107692 RepID=A0A2T1GHZ7_9CYAN|nr:DUF3119 family protein [Chamaesiphon polymorphus]PSB57341.1 DUF3119 domain-containing protein [Chamaesiphon polymorphus CCALA 037]
MITNPLSERLPDRVLLAPNYKIPIVLIAASISIATFQLWVGLAVGIFGIFLSIQTAIIKLEFTTTTLNVYRGDNVIRTFPYSEWENWEIFWQPAPILFYFKEVNSIHFLPIIFDPQMLRTCLEYYRPKSDGAANSLQ